MSDPENLPIRLLHHHYNPRATRLVEAWVNFATLQAGWFADEAHILDCQLELVDEQQFNAKVSQLDESQCLIAREHGIVLGIASESLKVEGMIRVVLNKDPKAFEKQLKKTVKKVLVVLAAHYKLPEL